MGVLVHVFEADLVHVPVSVRYSIVSVLVLVFVFDMLMIVRRVCMRVRHVAVRVRVHVRVFMCVLFAHTTPVVA